MTPEDIRDLIGRCIAGHSEEIWADVRPNIRRSYYDRADVILGELERKDLGIYHKKPRPVAVDLGNDSDWLTDGGSLTLRGD